MFDFLDESLVRSEWEIQNLHRTYQGKCLRKLQSSKDHLGNPRYLPKDTGQMNVVFHFLTEKSVL